MSSKAQPVSRQVEAVPSARSRMVGVYVLIWTVALAFRAIYLLELGRSPVSTLLLGDAITYDSWAQEIARGDWLGNQVFYQAPLYPYFLGALYTAFGRSLLVVKIVQVILGASSCVLLAHAAVRFFSRPTGIVVGLLLALYPTAISFDGSIQKSVLDLFFMCLLLCIMGETIRRPHRLLWLAGGAVLGLLALTRENALVLFPVMLVWALMGGQEAAMSRRLANAGWLVLALGIVLLPVALRNQAMGGGGFHLTTAQFGPNFYIGNNKEADGQYQPLQWGHGSAKFEQRDAVMLAETAVGRKLTAGEASHYWTQKAISDIRGDVGRWLWLMAKKWMLVWNATELGDSDDQYTYGEFSTVLRLLNQVLHFGVICPLAAAGVCLTWARRRTLWVLYTMAVAYAASVALFYVFSRYRFPMVPVLLLFAGAGLVKGWARLKEWKLENALVGGVIILTVAVFTNWSLVNVDEMRAITHHNIAVSLVVQHGKPEQAIAHYREAVRLKPDFAVAHEELGALLLNGGKVTEAINEFRLALQARPDYPEALSNLGAALASQGRLDEAVALLSRAAQLQPNRPTILKNLAAALSAQGKLAEATLHYRVSLRVEPNDASTHYALGLALALQGKWDEAIEHYQEALRLAPTNAEAQYNLGYALRVRGRIDEAVTHLREALQLKPEFPLAHYNLGCVLADKGQRDEAIVHLKEALRLKPDYQEARQRLRALGLEPKDENGR